MQYTRHGGACCGISHISGFDRAAVAQLDEVLSQHDYTRDHGTPGNRLLEAVLTDRQLDRNNASYDERITPSVRAAGGWGNVLASRGFVLVHRFQNSNTGRYCNVFHRVRHVEALTGLPWLMEPQPVQPVPPATHEIQTLDDLTRDHVGRPDLLTTREGFPLRISAVSENSFCVRLVNPTDIWVLPGDHTITHGSFSKALGHYFGLVGTEGSVMVRRRPEEEFPVDADVQAAPARVAPAAPVVAPEVLDQTRWSDETLTPETAVAGRRVRYSHRPGIGSTPRLDGATGFITFVRARQVTVRWEPQRPGTSTTFNMNRFVYELPEEVVQPEPEPEPVPVREPVRTTQTQYFAIRRDGTRAGPYRSERQAREHWSRVRQYLSIQTELVDGELQNITETVIAA